MENNKKTYILPRGELMGKVVTKPDDDPKRHKGRCMYYCKGSCQINANECLGSRGCKEYREGDNKGLNKAYKEAIEKYQAIMDSTPKHNNKLNVVAKVSLDDPKMEKFKSLHKRTKGRRNKTKKNKTVSKKNV